MSRFFWLKSDGKTVQEISFEAYQKLTNHNWRRSCRNKHKLAVVHDNGDMYCMHGRLCIYLQGAQLKQVLEAI